MGVQTHFYYHTDVVRLLCRAESRARSPCCGNDKLSGNLYKSSPVEARSVFETGLSCVYVVYYQYI